MAANSFRSTVQIPDYVHKMDWSQEDARLFHTSFKFYTACLRPFDCTDRSVSGVYYMIYES